MKSDDQLIWTELPEALRQSVDFDAATEILSHLTTPDAIDGDDHVECAVAPIERRPRGRIQRETIMWF